MKEKEESKNAGLKLNIQKTNRVSKVKAPGLPACYPIMTSPMATVAW